MHMQFIASTSRDTIFSRTKEIDLMIGAIYIAKTANMTAATTLPNAILLLEAAPVNATAEVEDGLEVTVAFDTPTEEKVVAAGTAVVTPATWAAAVVATTRAAEAVVAPATVVNWT